MVNARHRSLDPADLRWRWLNWPGWSRRLVAACFFALVNWLMLAPAGAFRNVHVFLAHQDKIAHFGIFLALAMVVSWSLPAGWGRGWPQAAAQALLTLYAGAIEVLQPLLAGSGRVFEWLDMACNLAGIGVALLLFRFLAAGPGPADEDFPGLRLLSGDPQ